MRVDTQAQKAMRCRIFAGAMADLPFVVGYHYFMWADAPAPASAQIAYRQRCNAAKDRTTVHHD
jgi:hypothetical protein